MGGGGGGWEGPEEWGRGSDWTNLEKKRVTQYLLVVYKIGWLPLFCQLCKETKNIINSSPLPL